MALVGRFRRSRQVLVCTKTTLRLFLFLDESSCSYFVCKCTCFVILGDYIFFFYRQVASGKKARGCARSAPVRDSVVSMYTRGPLGDSVLCLERGVATCRKRCNLASVLISFGAAGGEQHGIKGFPCFLPLLWWLPRATELRRATTMSRRLQAKNVCARVCVPSVRSGVVRVIVRPISRREGEGRLVRDQASAFAK